MEHDTECAACAHDCPWLNNPMGAPYCAVCADHWENTPFTYCADCSQDIADDIFDIHACRVAP